MALDLLVLTALGAAIVALTGWMATWGTLAGRPKAFAATLLAQLALYGLAAGWVIGRRPAARGALAIVLLVALAARVAFALQPPTASDDIYRYVWDGRIQSEGINPYRHTPNDPALAQYRDQAIYQGVNRKGVPTIYPPVAQAVFRLVYWLHPDSVVWTKLAFIGLDLVTIGVIAGLLLRLGLRPERALLYAWHPLLILELGHSGHIDTVAIFFLLLALRARLAGSPIRAGILLAGATLVKPYAIVALPALLHPARRRDLRLPLALVTAATLAYLPFLTVGPQVLGYLPGYLQEEGITSGRRFYLLQGVGRIAQWGQPGWPQGLGGIPLTAAQGYQLLVVVVMGALAFWCWTRPLESQRAIANRVVLLFVTFLALTTPTYPWYTLLALAALPLVRGALLLPASAAVGSAGFLYLQWWWPGGANWPAIVAYGGSAGTLALTGVWTVARGVSRHLRPPQPVHSSHTARAGRSAVPTTGLPRPAMPTASAGQGASAGPGSLFDRFPWFYAFCREWMFRDHTVQIAGALWPAAAPPAGSRLLELGCGPGFYARRLAARFEQLRVTGIDRAEGQLRQARSRAAAQRLPNCVFERGDVLRLPRPTNAVEAIVASRLCTVLPNLPERRGALAEMHRVLSPGGRCFIAEPRSPLWTAVPLRALWLLAGLAALRGEGRSAYREPKRATVLTVAEFDALVHSQPWAQVRHWHDTRYHYAVCEKGTAGIARLAAD